MSTETQKTTTASTKKGNRLKIYGIAGFLLIFLLFAIFTFLKINKLKKELISQKNVYEVKLDSIHTADMTTVAKTLSWAVRGDLLRNNNDQAQLHLDNFIKEPHVKKAYVVDTNTEKIILSTDKTEMGMPYPDFTVIGAKKISAGKVQDRTQIVVPMMELNKKLAVLVVSLEDKR